MTKSSILRNIGLATLAAPLALTLSVLAPTPADAFGIQNCTGVPIRAHVFNDRDTVRLRAEKNSYISPGKFMQWHKLSNQKKYVRIFDAGLLDQQKVARNALNRNWDYRITLTGQGEWKIVEAGHPVGSCP